MPKKSTLSSWISGILRDHGANHALTVAARSGTISELKIILASGADATGPTGAQALRAAVARNGAPFVKKLLEHGAKDAPFGPSNETSFLIAVNRGFINCVRLLLPEAELDRVNGWGRAALEEAEQFGAEREEIAQMIRDEVIFRRVSEEVKAISEQTLPGQAAALARARI